MTLILSSPEQSHIAVGAWLQRKGAHERLIRNIAPLVWENCLYININPIYAICQVAKETGWGKYPGKVPPEFNNVCGLKIRHASGDRIEDHAQFGTLQAGVRAYLTHLVAYLGKKTENIIYPFVSPDLDPRWELVSGKPITTWEELGGRWAPSLTYGEDIVSMAKDI